jgi:hypothetical protein
VKKSILLLMLFVAVGFTACDDDTVSGPVASPVPSNQDNDINAGNTIIVVICNGENVSVSEDLANRFKAMGICTDPSPSPSPSPEE